jgi:hypothetical protein
MLAFQTIITVVCATRAHLLQLIANCVRGGEDISTVCFPILVQQKECYEYATKHCRTMIGIAICTDIFYTRGSSSRKSVFSQSQQRTFPQLPRSVSLVIMHHIKLYRRNAGPDNLRHGNSRKLLRGMGWVMITRNPCVNFWSFVSFEV